MMIGLSKVGILIVQTWTFIHVLTRLFRVCSLNIAQDGNNERGSKLRWKRMNECLRMRLQDWRPCHADGWVWLLQLPEFIRSHITDVPLYVFTQHAYYHRTRKGQHERGWHGIQQGKQPRCQGRELGRRKRVRRANRLPPVGGVVRADFRTCSRPRSKSGLQKSEEPKL